MACLLASHSGSKEEGVFICPDDGVMKAVNSVMGGVTVDVMHMMSAYKK